MIAFPPLAAFARRLVLAACIGATAFAAAQQPAAPAEHGLVDRYYTLAKALEEQGHDAEAREQYLRVLEREEHHLPTLYALALLERRADRLDAAVDYAGRFLDTWRYLKQKPPELYDARRALAELVTTADPLRKRFDALRRSYVGKLLELANRQMDRASWHSARAMLVEAIATDPEHPDLAAGLERIKLEGGNELAVEDETGGSDPLAGVTPEWVAAQDQLHAKWDDPWTEETEHYRIRTDAGYRMLRTVANAMEQMHQFYRIFHQYKVDGGGVPQAGVFIFKNRDEYKKLGAAPTDWAGGHWDGSKVVTYDQRGGEGDGSLRDTLQVLFHEASHQFTSLAGGSTVPAWLNEGMASFFEGTRLLSNGKVDWNLVAGGRLYPLVDELRKPDRNHLANVIRGEVDDYRVYYPWGWGIVYYLYNAEDETGRLLYRPLMKEYFQEYNGSDHLGRFTEYFIQRAKVPGVKTLDDFEKRFVDAMFRLEAEDKGEVDAARAYEERGDLQVALADWPRAVELYDRALQRDPDHPDVLWKLAFALERAGLEDRAAGTLRQWMSVVDLDDDHGELAEARRAEAEKRILKLDDLARRLASAREDFHAQSVALATEYRAKGFPRTALRVLQGPATAQPPSAAARELYFAIQDESGVGLESWKLLFDEQDLKGFYGDGLDSFRVVDGTIVGRIEGTASDEQPGGGRRKRGERQAPVTGIERRMGTSFVFRRLFIDREPAGDWSLSAEIGLGADCRMAGICFGKKQDGLFHGAALLPEGFVDLSRFELDGEPIVRAATKLKKDWNRLQIDVAGTRLVVSVNGEVAIDYQFETRAALLGDFGLLAGEGTSSYREVRMLEYDRGIPRRARIGRRPSGARVTESGAYTAPERATAGAPTFLGSAPPLLRGCKFVHEAPEEGNLDRLLGWPVLLVFTKSTVEPTHPVLPVLDKIAEKYGELRIPVLIVSNEQHDKVAEWVERTPVKYPVASCWEQEAYEDYALVKHGIPRMLLLDVDGSVAWEGNPDYDPEYGAYVDEPLAELVKRRKLVELRAAGPELERAQALFDQGKYVEAAEAWRAVAALDVPHPAVSAARAGLKRVEERAAERMEEARAFREAKRTLQALAVMNEVANAFAGTRAAGEASEEAEALAKTKEYHAALKAGNRVMRAEKLLVSGKIDDLKAALQTVLEKATAEDDPWVAERASWLLEGIAAQPDAGELLSAYLERWPELEDPRRPKSE